MTTSTPSEASYANAQLLVESSWLAQNLNAPGLRIVDVRDSAKYADSHISNALSLPISVAMVNQPFPNELPSPAAVETLLGDLGIGNDSARIVVYDDSRGLAAARAFWTLEYFGFKDKVAILNGGYPKWQQENRETTRLTPKPDKVTFTARPDASLLAGLDGLLARLGKPGFAVMDTRTSKEYLGEDLRGNKKGGHVPGAVNLNWEDTMTQGDAAIWKTPETLYAIYADKGLREEMTVAVYCQTGVRAAHGYFTLRLLGYNKVMVYDGSMAEWNNRMDTPVETKPNPTVSND
ncbi:MAG: sulfurtransferase [Dehalococcoidales bacterium]|nr:sulfurtransferase [Dehalococcoidales bacterium]